MSSNNHNLFCFYFMLSLLGGQFANHDKCPPKRGFTFQLFKKSNRKYLFRIKEPKC